MKQRKNKSDTQYDRIWKIVQENSIQIKELRMSQAETDRQIKELRLAQLETDKQLKETDRQIKELRVSQAETDRQIKELRLAQSETDKQQKETDRQIQIKEELRVSQAETDRLIKELGKKIGELTNGWGEFAKDFVARSVKKIVSEIITLEGFYGPRISAFGNGRSCEVDFYATGRFRGEEVVLIVEVKTKHHKEDSDELEEKIKEFDYFFGSLVGRKKIGAIAYIRYNDKAEMEIWKRGFYTIFISEDSCKLTNPPSFEPKLFE